MYKVGQVLYVILQKKQRIIPVQVVEQIVRRTVEGEKIQYLVRGPGREEDIDLDTFGDQVFEDLDVVKSTLRQNIFKVIDDMASKALEIAGNYFEIAQSDPACGEESHNQEESGEPTGDTVRIQLENGQMANVKISAPTTVTQKKR